jgi:TRAP-type C4-dicarboxylate transport system permease small subunit
MSLIDSETLPSETLTSTQAFKSEDILSLIIFWGLAVLLFAQFFSRYALSASLGWSEEIARYLLILLAFSGASIASRNDAHIGVTLLHRYLSVKALNITKLCIAMLNLFVVLLLLFYAGQIAISLHAYSLASLPVSIGWVYALMCACLLLMLVRSAMVVKSSWRAVCSSFSHKAVKQ